MKALKIKCDCGCSNLNMLVQLDGEYPTELLICADCKNVINETVVHKECFRDYKIKRKCMVKKKLKIS